MTVKNSIKFSKILRAISIVGFLMLLVILIAQNVSFSENKMIYVNLLLFVLLAVGQTINIKNLKKKL